MNLQESIRRILREERDLSKIIVKLLDRLIVSKYEDVCKIKVVHSSVTSDYSFYRVIVYFKQGTEKRSRTWEENVLNEVWEYVNDVFGFSVALHSVRVLSCDDMTNEENSGKLNEDIVDTRFKKMNLQESIRRILREEAGLPLYLKRRIGIRELEHDFNMLINFEIKSVKNRDLSLEQFKRKIVSTLMDIFHGALSDWETVDFDYDHIYDSLMNYFSPRITEKYIEHLYNG